MIVRYDQFKPSPETIKFFDAKPNKNGQGKNVRFTYNGNSLYVQTEKLRNPFGLSKGVEGTDQYGKKFSCTLSFNMQSPKGKAFRKAMDDLQDMLAREAYENRVEWGIGKNKKESRDLTEKEVRNKMTNIVRIPYDKKTGEEITDYAPTFRVTFNTKNNETTGEVTAITSEIFNENGDRIRDVDEDTIKAGGQVKVLMYANSAWVSSAGYGINWRIKQIKLYPSDGLPTGKCLINDEDEDDDDESGAPSSSTRSTRAPQRDTTPTDESDPPEDEVVELEDDEVEQQEDEDDEDEDTKPKRLSLRNRQ